MACWAVARLMPPAQTRACSLFSILSLTYGAVVGGRARPQVARQWGAAEFEGDQVVFLVVAGGGVAVVGVAGGELPFLECGGVTRRRADGGGPAGNADRGVDVRCVTVGLMAPGVRCGSGSTAPAALIVIPPVVSGGCGLVDCFGFAFAAAGLVGACVLEAGALAGSLVLLLMGGFAAPATGALLGDCPPAAAAMIRTQTRAKNDHKVMFSVGFGVGCFRKPLPRRSHTPRREPPPGGRDRGDGGP